MIRKLIYKMRKRRFCKLNGWFCPDCIYHDFIFEGAVFRGNKCRYPRQTEREGRVMSDYEAFVHELIGYIFKVQDKDDDNLSAELICRKLYKYGLIENVNHEWRMKYRPKHRWPATVHNGRADKEDWQSYTIDRKTENSSEKPNNSTISKMEQVDKDINVRSKDEPQTDCETCKHHVGMRLISECNYEAESQTNADQHVQHVGSVESVEPTWTKEEHEAFYTFLWNVINPNEMQDYIEMFETRAEPQTDCAWK